MPFFDKDDNKIHKRLMITGNKKVTPLSLLCVNLFSSGIIFISIQFIFMMLSSSSFFIFVFPHQQEGKAMEMQILVLPHADQGV